MANPATTRNPAQSVNELLNRDPAEGRRMDEPESRRLLDQFGPQVRRYFDEATEWVDENRGTLAIVGGIAAVGIIGVVAFRLLRDRRHG